MSKPAPVIVNATFSPEFTNVGKTSIVIGVISKGNNASMYWFEAQAHTLSSTAVAAALQKGEWQEIELKLSAWTFTENISTELAEKEHA